MDALQKMSCRNIGEIERRVLPQKHDVNAGEIDEPSLAQTRVIALEVLDLQRLRHGFNARAVEPQTIGRVIEDAMAARLRFEEKREGRNRPQCGCARSGPLHGDGKRHVGSSGKGQSISSLYADGA